MKNIDYQMKKRRIYKTWISFFECQSWTCKNSWWNQRFAFDRKSFYQSALVDKESYYPRIATGFLFTSSKEKTCWTV